MAPAPFTRNRERALILGWLGLCALAVLFLLWWGVAHGGAERAIQRWSMRWLPRLERGEQLVAAERWEDAVSYLEALDRDFPAISIKLRHAAERERLLELLGRSHTALDHKRRALDTFGRLVAFDPRNWRSSFLLGDAALHFGEAQQAEQAFRDVLSIHPSHLPTVRALIGLKYEGGEYDEVAPVFEAYVDAWLLGRMTLKLGDAVATIEVPVDGREQLAEVVWTGPARPGGEVCLETGGYSVRLKDIELIAPRRVGVAGPPGSTVLDGAEGWAGAECVQLTPGEWSAHSVGASVCRSTPDPGEVARARWKLTAFKALDAETWALVVKSYENALDHDGLRAMQGRVVVGGCLEAGSVFLD